MTTVDDRPAPNAGATPPPGPAKTRAAKTGAGETGAAKTGAAKTGAAKTGAGEKRLVRPYGDTTGDGMVQLSFTLPIPHDARAEGAALQLGRSAPLRPPTCWPHRSSWSGPAAPS